MPERNARLVERCDEQQRRLTPDKTADAIAATTEAIEWHPAIPFPSDRLTIETDADPPDRLTHSAVHCA